VVPWIAFALAALAALVDWRRREIPDAIPLALCVLAATATALGLHGLGWGAVALGGALALMVGAALFAVGGLGGGDVKLLVGLGACTGPQGLATLGVAAALAGGVLSAVAWTRGRREVAYGPALALGALAAALPDEAFRGFSG